MSQWMRVDLDAPDSSAMLELGFLLGDRDRALACMVRLWAQLCRQTTNGTVKGEHADGLVEQWAGWTDDPGAFVDACVRVRFLVRGAFGLRSPAFTSRYGVAAEKAQKDAERMRTYRAEKKAQKAPGTDSDGAAPAAAVRERSANVLGTRRDVTERDEKLVTADAAATPSPVRPPFALEAPVVAPPKPVATKRARQPSIAEALAVRLQARRAEVLGPDAEPDPLPAAPKLNKQLGALIATHSAAGVEAAWEVWLCDDWARSRAPAFAMKAFLSPEVCATRAATAKRASPAVPPVATKPPCSGCGAASKAPVWDAQTHACEACMPAALADPKAWAEAHRAGRAA